MNYKLSTNTAVHFLLYQNQKKIFFKFIVNKPNPFANCTAKIYTSFRTKFFLRDNNSKTHSDVTDPLHNNNNYFYQH